MKEPLIFDIGQEGRKAYSLPDISFTEKDIKKLIPGKYLRDNPPDLPQVSELDIVRHFTRLSQLNYSVDTNMYPLGSCTMKYNPLVCDKIVSDKNFSSLHPFSPEELSQGILKILYDLQEYLCEICGMDGITLQPTAGAHGELTGLLLIRKYHKEKGESRTKIIVPDSSHGTNPSSAHIAGFVVETIPTNRSGEVDLDVLECSLDKNTAAVMITNPNTLGIFESKILKISEMVHKCGALLYGDGANMNALIGKFRPGDMGFDVIHLNLHKTFATPHGGGGPGSGPVLVKDILKKYLPVPVIVHKNGKYSFDYNRPKTVGMVHAFYGNTGVNIRAYVYIRSLGRDEIKKIGEIAVLNANYMKQKLKKSYKLKYDKTCMHEFVLSSKKYRALDIAKRLLDYGFYAPTIYFPLIVPEALMIEPTETETKQSMDDFIEALNKIQNEDPSIVKNAPIKLPVRRLDEVGAARNPDLAWKRDNKTTSRV